MFILPYQVCLFMKVILEKNIIAKMFLLLKKACGPLIVQF